MFVYVYNLYVWSLHKDHKLVSVCAHWNLKTGQAHTNTQPKHTHTHACAAWCAHVFVFISSFFVMYVINI